jgi:LysM repeat protein
MMTNLYMQVERSKTMKKQPLISLSRRILQLTISVLIALSLVALAIPQKVQAYPYYHCRTWHVVQEGDTTPKISHTYGLKWRKIARANNLPIPTKLSVGQRLCIPTDGTVVNALTASTASKDVSVGSRNNLIWIKASGFDKKNLFYVKVRDITSGAGKWYRLGRLKVNRWSVATHYYQLPKELRSSIYMQVCLKNAHTNGTICRNVRHLYY